MSKFKDFLTATGDAVIKKRANNLTTETKENFEEELRITKKSIRDIENKILSMEDLSIRTTQSLVVGEDLNTMEWVKKRINLELQLRDLKIEKEIIQRLIEEYFDEGEKEEKSFFDDVK